MCNGMKGVGLCLLMMVGVNSYASNLGHYGQVFPVIEEDIRTIIMKRLQAMDATGELARHQREVEQRVSSHVLRPTPLALTTTIRPVMFHVDPTVTVSHDVWTPDGTLVAKAGMRINPFAHVSLSKTLLFFNGDDKQQVAWASRHYKDYRHVKFILTGGDIRDASNTFGRIYFDIGGALTSQLQVKHVPSVAYQDGLVWTVKEIGANDV